MMWLRRFMSLFNVQSMLQPHFEEVWGRHIRNQNWGFSSGKIREIILLNSPLLSWDGILDYKDISKEKLSSIVLLILNYDVINDK